MPFTKDDPNINRKGRPRKGFAFNEAIEKAGRKTVEGPDGKRKARYRLLAEKLWDLALNGDIQVAKYLSDRIGGKPTEKVEVTGEEGGPIGVVFLPQNKSAEDWISEHGGNRESVDSAAETEAGA